MNCDTVSNVYLSAVTPLGFVSRLSSLCDPSRFEHVFLLKGGSRSLRSQLICDAARYADSNNLKVYTVPSAMDKDKLEAAYWDKTAVIDAAPPYCIEPAIPSAFEDIVWLGGCYQKELHQNRSELVILNREEDDSLEQARKFLFAADELIKDNRRAALCCADAEKIERQALKAAKKYLTPSEKGITACVSHAVFGSRKFELPPDFSFVLLQDMHGGCAQHYLKTLLTEAKRQKSNVIVFYSPFAPYGIIDMLLVCDAKICFAAESEAVTFSKPADSIINARRFTDKQKLCRVSVHLRQNRTAAKQLYSRAALYFDKASCFRQKKEEIYNYFFDTAEFDSIRQTLFANMF